MAGVGVITESELNGLSLLYEELIGEKTDAEKMRAVYRSISADPRCFLLGARDAQGRLVGSVYAILCEDPIGASRPFMVIENVIVSARARRSGAGRRLMERAEALAREHRCAYVMLVSAAHARKPMRFTRPLATARMCWASRNI